jgi:hypothetical protein
MKPPVKVSVTVLPIVPSRTVVREWDQSRGLAAAQRGKQLRLAIERLKQLIEAYRNHDLQQRFF